MTISRSLFFVILLTLSGCSDPITRWHQRMTVIVETPDGVRQASSVLGVGLERSDGISAEIFKNMAGASYRWHYTGEAVALDLGEGRWLFALFADYEPGYIALKTLLGEGSKGYSRDAAVSQAVADYVRDVPVEVPTELYPLLVTFEDINDPASVRSVDPANLAASFGEGYALDAITLEITDALITTGVLERVLVAWLDMAEGRDPSIKLNIPPLHLPNDSPRGYINLSKRKFWAADKLSE